MTISKHRRHVASLVRDSSVASAKTSQDDLERGFLARRPTVEQLIVRAKQERNKFIAALLWRAAARMKSLFRASAYPTDSAPSDA